MYVKRNEEGGIVSLFIGCVPDNVTEYTEEPDDQAVAKAFFAEQQAQQEPEHTTEARIKTLEDMLAAYEAAYAEGVAEA